MLLAIAGSALAQKSYLNLYVYGLDRPQSNKFGYGQTIYISGNIPDGIQSEYGTADVMYIGNLLTKLSTLGYSIEQMSTSSASSSTGTPITYETIIMSKPGSGSASVPTVAAGDDEATEVARYNLQGLPVTKSEKGIQIIVYSNYTTKTVIVE